MLVVVAVYSVLIVALGLYGLVSPSGITAFVRGFQAGPGVWGGFAIRLVFAIALWLAAPASATPSAFRVLAVLALLGAVALPAMGAARFAELAKWWSEQPALAVRIWLFAAVAFGLFTLWSSAAGLGWALPDKVRKRTAQAGCCSTRGRHPGDTRFSHGRAAAERLVR